MTVTTLQDKPGRNAALIENGALVARFAFRELRAGLGGFYVFIACVALGVCVISGVAMLGASLKAGFEAQGRAILGGDLAAARIHQRATDAERRVLDRYGSVSETATMRAMARKMDGSDQALIELKGIDGAYPLVGKLELEGDRTLADVMAAGGAAVDPILLERLGLLVGDTVRIGEKPVRVMGIIRSEPDRIADRVSYGARVLVSVPTLEATGLIQPGSLVRWRYAVALTDESPGALLKVRDDLRDTLPEAGFLIADRRDPSPQVTRTLERLAQFLTLLGVTALLVGGVGVANAVATFLDRRRRTIATYKSLGATGGTVFAVFLTQVMMITTIGVVVGLALGVAVPVLLDRLYGDSLPTRIALDVDVWRLLPAAAYGYLVALVFALWPLGRARDIRPAALFRDDVSPGSARPRWTVIVAIGVCIALLAALAILASDSKTIAAYYCGALLVIFALFVGYGILIERIARRVPRAPVAELAIAQASIAAPDGLTRSVVLSLGAGLSLLVAVSLVDAALVEELSAKLPQDSPDYFVLDLPRAEAAGFEGIVRSHAPNARIATAPMLRGRIVRLKGVPVEQITNLGDTQWVLNGDRGLTYADRVPDGSRITKGEWWSSTYDGPPLVSFETELAKRLKLDVGDAVTVNVLGRNVEARVASLREVKWESLAINFVMVFSPNTLRAAPHNLLATVRLDAPSTKAEVAMARELGTRLPSVTTIRVKDAIDAFAGIFTKVMTAVRVAASITLIAGALVLAGALATAQRRRVKEAVILKILGATRARILLAHATEYSILALATSGLAIILGSLAAWLALTQLMDLPFVLSGAAILVAIGLALAFVLAFGAIGTWQVLKARPVTYLRSE